MAKVNTADVGFEKQIWNAADVLRGSMDAAVMNIMRWELYRRAKALWLNVDLTYGYITKHTRIHAGLEKSHRIDARCISEHPTARPSEHWFSIRQTRRHNRQVMKARILKGGRLKRNQAPYLVHGYRLFDKVLLNGRQCFIIRKRSPDNSTYILSTRQKDMPKSDSGNSVSTKIIC